MKLWPILFYLIGPDGEHQKSPSGVTRKAFLVSNNGRIYVSHATEKKERTTADKNEGNCKFTCKQAVNPLGRKDLRRSLKNRVIILDFSPNVKRKSE